jgi:hypothetical protein
MIGPILSKLCGIILENKINIWLESHRKIAKVQAKFRSYYSTMDHLITLRIIVEECRNNKINLVYCFVDFRNFLTQCLGLTFGI